MKIIKNRFLPYIFQICLGIFFFINSAFAQQNSVSVYNSTIDQINCETIRFIHREAGRAEIANNMECFTFEGILKSIPEDEARTTAALAKDIEAYKGKFKNDASLETQLDNVIAFVTKKIEAKPRKGNVSDFKQKLQNFKKDALENISGAPAEATPATEEAAIEEEGIVLTDTEPEGASDTNWLSWLTFLLALTSLGISAYLLSQLGKLKNRPAAPMANYNTEEGNRPRNTPDLSANLQRLEEKMDRELSKINHDLNEKIAAVTASTGYTQPERYAAADENYEEENEEETSDFLPTPLDQADAPILTTEERVPELEEEEIPEEKEEIQPEEKKIENFEKEDIVTEEEEKPLPVVLEEVVEEPAKPRTFLGDDVQEEEIGGITEENQPEEEEIEEVPETTFAPRSDASANMPPVVPMQNQPLDEDEEDAIALPDYKYLGLPLADGSFSPDSFLESPAEDSLYEVEMYEDVPNKAFFSPLLYPEILEKTIAEPEKYLSPCCMFLNDSAGKSMITVIEEGRLRKQGERWYIYEKARIRFD